MKTQSRSKNGHKKVPRKKKSTLFSKVKKTITGMNAESLSEVKDPELRLFCESLSLAALRNPDHI